MMNEHPYFHWDLLRQPLQTPQFGMAPSFFDVSSILELRKEKSRDAARSRRGKENYEFYELAKLLPLPAAITSQLDKASIIRLTISYLKLRNFSCHGDPPWTPEGGGLGSVGGNNKNGKVLQGHRSMDILDPFESRQGTHILQSLDGFAFILANDGRFLYISETVSIYLGLSQVEMAGSSIFDYVHHDDHGELTDYLGMCSVPAPGPANTPPSSGSDDAASPGQRSQTPSERSYAMVNQRDKSIHKSFSIRMKSTLTKRGAHVKTSGFRVLHILGTLRPQSIFALTQGNSQSGSTTGGGSNNADNPPMGLVGMAIALPPPTVSELRLEMDTFILRLSPDFRVVYCDPPLGDLMDLSPEDVTDRLLYDLCHAADLKLLQQAHSDIISKGQVLSDYWRMLNRHGGYTWVQTYATTLFNNKTSEEQTVLAINYVISDIRSSGRCVDLWQVTGDVSSSMSSTYRSPIREKLLQGLPKKEAKKEERSNSRHNKSYDPPLTNQKSHDNDIAGNSLDVTDSNGALNKTNNTESQHLTASSIRKDYDMTTCNTGNLPDSKNNRRKMENPRKRKKSEEDSESSLIPSKIQSFSVSNTTGKTIPEGSNLDLPPFPQGNRLQSDSLSTITNAAHSKNSRLSPSPEDLSLKKTLSTSGAAEALIQDSSDIPPGNKPSHDTITSKIQSSQKQMPRSSVHDLEAVMNRHLPRQPLDPKIQTSIEKGNMGISETPETSNAIASKIASIPPFTPQCGQWIPPSPRTPPATAGDVFPTSNILRCLYTTRESVIKTNARPQNSTTYLNGETPSSLLTPPEPESSETLSSKDQNRTSQHGKQINFDQPHLCPTSTNPQFSKGSEFSLRDSVFKDNSIKDQFQFLQYKDHLSSAYIDHFTSSTGYKDHMTSPYKDFPQFKDIVPAFTIPSLVNTGDRFQQNYHSLSHPFSLPVTSTHHQSVVSDPCSITPPASSSPDAIAKTSQTHNQHHPTHNHHQQQQSQTNHNPHQLLPHHHNQTFDSSSSYSSDVISNSYSSHLSNKHFTPIQFHHPHHPTAPSPNGGYHQYRHQDYTSPFHHSQDLTKGSYYGMAPSPVASMYMDLTNGTATQYEACHRPTLTWY